jgi:mRNA interferase MazF
MRRGEIRPVDLEPAIGAEANKSRPCVIVSNDASNIAAESLDWGVVTVVPITSAAERVYSFQVVLPARECGLRVDSKAHAEQIRAVAVQRVGPVVGHVPERLMAEISRALAIHLALHSIA